jgi:hypothetical protein
MYAHDESKVDLRWAPRENSEHEDRGIGMREVALEACDPVPL